MTSSPAAKMKSPLPPRPPLKRESSSPAPAAQAQAQRSLCGVRQLFDSCEFFRFWSEESNSSGSNNSGKQQQMDAGKYVRCTPEQVEALERVYDDCPKPTSLRRQQIIRECPILANIEPKQIKRHTFDLLAAAWISKET
ncbi:hypothetical protein CASFOL_010323 [Castilleja foliolosa]|uniref:Homeobox domain-containing protein n=1 Tax=Castilleja foliolosa TaxID=1961234 RepID=A0ABD3DS89_9LAMI